MRKNIFNRKILKKLLSYTSIKYHLSRIFTITEKNVKLYLRFKSKFVFSFVSPFLGIILSLIILTKFLGADINFGEGPGTWDDRTMPLFILMAYNLELLSRVITDFPADIRLEKYWKTLPALMIAPFNKIHLFFGILLSHLVIISVPFIIFVSLAYFIVPISFLTLIFIFFIYLLIDIIFSGFGLFLGVFAISNENYWRYLIIIQKLIWYISCVSYPLDIFPSYIQSIIQLNPFYYLFDFLRITWYQDNISLTLSSYPFHFFILIGMSFIIPLVSIYIFKKVYNKLGIVGY